MMIVIVVDGRQIEFFFFRSKHYAIVQTNKQTNTVRIFYNQNSFDDDYISLGFFLSLSRDRCECVIYMKIFRMLEKGKEFAVVVFAKHTQTNHRVS